MKCIKTIKSLTIVFAVFLHQYLSVSYGQTAIESFNALNLETFRKMPVNERVVLFTDREVYLCGDNIVFSAYLYEGNWFLPLSLSSVLYIEIYNQDNSVITNGKFQIKNGKGSGSITIPRTIHTDVYYLRAYTNYMKNFGFHQFYVQKLKIVNPNINPPDYIALIRDSVDINCQIFPEGNKLISGIRSKVGCRFIDSDGEGINVIARLVDINRNIITTFRTYKNGFATFEFVPQAGIDYSIEAVSENSQAIIPMPKPVKNGVILTKDTLTSEYLTVKINSNDQGRFPLRLTARYGDLIYSLHETAINSAGVYNIPLQKIPAGLISLELKDLEGNLVADRLIYIKPFKKLEIELKTDKEKYAYRKQINVMINARDDKGLPVMTDLVLFSGLSDNELASGNNIDLCAGLLAQDLRKIFINENDLIVNSASDEKLLEMVLLISPAAIRKDTFTLTNKTFYYPEIDGDIISGKLLDTDNRPVEGVELLQSFVGKISWVESWVTDKNGQFYFITTNQKNRGDLILKAKISDKNTKIILENEFFELFNEIKKEKLRLTKNEVELLKKQFLNIQVEDAFSTEMKPSVTHSVRDSIPFYGKESTEFNFAEYVNLPNMKEFLFEIILGVINVKENKKDKIILMEENSLKKLGPDPLILIDGIPVTESEIVIGLDAEKVKSIGIVRNRFFYKNQIFDGIMDIHSKESDGSIFNLPSNTFRFKFIHVNEGEQIIETKITQSQEGKIPQYKNLLYWNSNVSTDKNGKAELSFLTPDNSGTFRIQCFGIAPQDLAGSGSKLIMVGE